MALALLFFGILLLVAGVRDTQGDLFTLLKGDLTGPNNFGIWILAFVLLGVIGYIPKLKPVSIALLTLVLIAIFVKKGTGFFDQITTGVKTQVDKNYTSTSMSY